MKRTKYFKIPLIFLMSILVLSCSSDDVEPVGGDGTEQPDPEPEPDPVPESEVPVGPSILKINSGGDELTFDSDVFEADKYFEGNGEPFVNDQVTEIDGTERDELYFSERISVANKGSFSYNIPVTNGTYTVKLYFAEIYWGAPNPENAAGEEGKRIFDVDIEGENKINNIDLFKEVGATTAVSRMYDVEVTDGNITIVFEASQDRPKLSALEIFGNGEIVD
ncbi:MAG: malectin domain-containing carbohydrate-binding protein [Flavobacteriaceae bacterium]